MASFFERQLQDYAVNKQRQRERGRAVLKTPQSRRSATLTGLAATFDGLRF
jgi:hypothetical protein